MSKYLSEDGNYLDPISIDHANIKLYSIIAHAAREAHDNTLAEIFWNLMHLQGSYYKCKGDKAIKEGEKHVNRLIETCKEKNFIREYKHVVEYAKWILAEYAQNGDFSNIIKLQQKQLDEGVKDVTQEGVEEANAYVSKLLDGYRSMPTISGILKKSNEKR